MASFVARSLRVGGEWKRVRMNRREMKKTESQRKEEGTGDGRGCLVRTESLCVRMEIKGENFLLKPGRKWKLRNTEILVAHEKKKKGRHPLNEIDCHWPDYQMLTGQWLDRPTFNTEYLSILASHVQISPCEDCGRLFHMDRILIFLFWARLAKMISSVE